MSDQSLDYLREGPKDFQQMILLYIDYKKIILKIRKILYHPLLNLDLNPMGFTVEDVTKKLRFLCL